MLALTVRSRVVVTIAVLVSAVLISLNPWSSLAAQELPPLKEITVRSSLDQEAQPVRLWVPAAAKTKPTPVLVFLHSWSGDYRQDNSKWLSEAVRREWIYLHPNFRGRNDHPEACGSRLARQDIIDALDHVLATYEVDRERVYLAGTSGGGHMTMLMAAYFPDHFSAASAWVGISDLSAWHEFHSDRVKGGPSRYAIMMQQCMGGSPGTSKAIDVQYRERSPLFHLQNAADCPLDINAGVNDGHTGSVPIRHALQAFNTIVKARSTPDRRGATENAAVTQHELEELSRDRKLSQPKKSDQITDATYGRDIVLRRLAGPTRVTIFDGGHEGLPYPACEWLAAQKRRVRTSADR